METSKSVQYRVDWLTITNSKIALHSAAEIASLMAVFDGRDWFENTAPPKGYSYAAKNDIGAIGGCSGDRQGCIIQWSGQAVAEIDVMKVVNLATEQGWKITRLDVNADFYGFDTEVEDYKQEYLFGQCQTRARTWDEHRSKGGGHTFYIGAWTSENFMRIYNKTASEARFTDVSELPDKWVRCELRMGDEHARSAMAYISAAGAETAIPMILRGYADFPNIQEYENMTEYPITTKGSGAKSTNTVKWLLETVVFTLGREARLDPDLWEEFKRRVELEIAQRDKKLTL